jgi:prepilin-type processing-associated H-X9-DG protein
MTLRTGPIRHRAGGVYVYADGHAKWMLPEKVFFPVRENGNRSHRDAKGTVTGPDPAGSMNFAGKTYDATFHIK